MWHGIKFRQQFDAVLPSDQNPLQCLAVLLHLRRATIWSTSRQSEKWEEETARRAASLVLLPAPDLQQRYRPGWDKSRTRATRIRCSQTVWALQDRSAAGTDPGEETQRWTVQVQLYKTQPSSNRAEMSCRLINQSHDYSLSFQLSLILVFILNWFKQDHVNNNVSFHLTYMLQIVPQSSFNTDQDVRFFNKQTILPL